MFRRFLSWFVVYGGLVIVVLVFAAGQRKIVRAVNPTIRAEIQQNVITLFNWPAGSTVTVTIDDPNTAAPVDYTTTLQPAPADWNPQATFASISLQGYDLKPGDIVRATDGVLTKELIVDFIVVDGANLNTDVVWGRANPGAMVEVQLVCYGQGLCATRWVTADATGNWQADFSQPGTRPDEQDVVDLTNNHFVEARVFDNDGDLSSFFWENPYHHVTIKSVLNINEVHVFNWPLNATLTLTIDDPNTANPADYTAAQTPQPGNWGPGASIAEFRLQGFTLAPGHIVRVTDGNYTREMVVLPLTITKVDATNDTIHGTALPGTEVVVEVTGVCDASGYCATRRVTADANGNWIADFSQPGTGSPGEFITVDLSGGMHGQALVFEPDGDTTGAFWWIPENRPPQITSLTLSQDVLKVATDLYLTVTIQDPDAQDTHTLIVRWGDGTEDSVPATLPTTSLSHRYSKAGIYGIQVVVVDASGATAQAQTQVIVYDPDAGFVKGEGAFTSPPGSYSPAPDVSGLVRLEVKVRYHHDKLKGEVELDFSEEGFEWEFASTQLYWMVVQENVAFIRGSGEIEEEREGEDYETTEQAQNYGFFLIVVDNGQDDQRVLIQIRNEATGEVIYNNLPDQPWSIDAAVPLEEGHIRIHRQSKVED